jgi:hypothetical protein
VPGRLERHRRAGSRSDYWDAQPPRSAERSAAAAEPDIRPPGRKDRWAHCKELKGPHKFAFAISRWNTRHRTCCGWTVGWNIAAAQEVIFWACVHQESCQGCGKIKRESIRAGECPDYRVATAEELAVLKAELAQCHAWRASWPVRRAPVTGPQGYRKTKPVSSPGG